MSPPPPSSLSPSSSYPNSIKFINAALINARSLMNKTLAVIDFFNDNNLDILFIIETWLTEHHAQILSFLNYCPFSFIHLPRANSSNYGGGLGALFKSNLSTSPLINHMHSYSEAFSSSIPMNHSKTFNSSLFYKSQSTSKTLFLEEFLIFTSQLSSSNIRRFQHTNKHEHLKCNQSCQ